MKANFIAVDDGRSEERNIQYYFNLSTKRENVMFNKGFGATYFSDMIKNKLDWTVVGTHKL